MRFFEWESDIYFWLFKQQDVGNTCKDAWGIIVKLLYIGHIRQGLEQSDPDIFLLPSCPKKLSKTKKNVVGTPFLKGKGLVYRFCFCVLGDFE